MGPAVLPSGQFGAVNIPLKEVIKFVIKVCDEAIAGAPGLRLFRTKHGPRRTEARTAQTVRTEIYSLSNLCKIVTW